MSEGILREDTNNEKEADMEGLLEVRKRAGCSQEELADRIGTSRPNVSAYESGGKIMGLKIANKVLEEIGESSVSAEELVIANRLKAYKRARDAGDVPRMFSAAKDVAKIGEGRTLTTEGNSLVNEIVDDALEYAEKAYEDPEDPEDQDDLDGDGRDLYGRRIRPLDEAGDGQDDEEDQDEDDERDIFGRRIGG
jgi:transcriptional regulator with XRE-family HTH domain